MSVGLHPFGTYAEHGADCWACCFCLGLAAGQLYRELRFRGKLVHPPDIQPYWCFPVRDEVASIARMERQAAAEAEHLRAREKLKADGRLLLANLTQTEAPPTTEVLFKNTCGRCGFMFTNVRHFTCGLFLYV